MNCDGMQLTSGTTKTYGIFNAIFFARDDTFVTHYCDDDVFQLEHSLRMPVP